MIGNRIGLALLALFTTLFTAEPTLARPATTDIARACQGHDGWADPAPAAHIFGRSWYVGTCGITAVLIDSGVKAKRHLVLIDGGPAEAAPLVEANIRALGFALDEVAWILSTHEHNDHAGAFAQLKRDTGAKLAAGRVSATVFASGDPAPDDPQAGIIKPIAPLPVDRVLAPQDRVQLGTLVLTARATPAHSPGSTSWSWRACEGRLCHSIAYADSASTVSADDYRFGAHPARIAAVGAGLRAIAAMPCDILLTPHPEASNLLARLSGQAPLVAPDACRAYAAAARARFLQRLATEKPGR
jgi:metallo-beta-lactamase class B